MKSLKKGGFWSKLRMPHIFTLLFAIIVVVGIVSLIMSYAGITYVNNEGKETAILGSGILEWIGAIPAGIVNAVWVIVFLLILGAFINVIIQSKALEAAMGRIGLKLKNIEVKDYEDRTSFSRYMALTGEFFRHTWVILPLVMFFAFAGTTYGMAEESLAFYVIIIPLTMAAGFDMWTGFLIIFAGAGIGVMASTVNPFSVLTANDAMKNAVGEGYKPEVVKAVNDAAASGLVWRWVTWAVLSSMTAIFVMYYAFRVKKNKANAKFADMFEVHNKQFGQRSAEIPTLTKRRLITTILFMLTFVILVLGMLNYDNLAGRDYDTGTVTAGSPLKFHYDNFSNNNATSWLHNDAVAQSTAYGGGYGWEFGWWYWLAITSLFVIMTIVLGVVNRNSEQEFMQNVTVGAKDMLAVSLAVGISRGVSVLLKGTNMEQYFAKELANVLAKSEGNKNITIPLISYILFIPLTFVIPSTSGLANATFGIIGPSVAEAEPTALSGVVTGYAMGAGFANMFVPTYAVVIGAIAITKISFVRFAKSIASFLGLAFVVGLLMIVIGGAVTTADSQIF